MRRLTYGAFGIALALGASGVLAGCDNDSEPDSAATTTDPSSRDAGVGSASASALECTLVDNVSAAVEQAATLNEGSSVATAEEARDALLSAVQELEAGSQALRTIDVKALNEGLAEIASAVSSVSGAATVESAFSSLQGSARDLEVSIHELADHFRCTPDAG